MDVLKLQIPLSFIEAQLGEASWRDIQFGLEQELVAFEIARELALEQLEQDDPPPALVDLATSNGSAVILPLVREVAEAEARLEKSGWLTIAGGKQPERRVGGRFPDLVMERDGKVIAVQVGRVTQGNVPISRERRALDDLRATGEFDHVFFLRYGP